MDKLGQFPGVVNPQLQDKAWLLLRSFKEDSKAYTTPAMLAAIAFEARLEIGFPYSKLCETRKR